MVGRNRSGALATLDAERFTDALGAGVSPVSFGDVVRDDAWGFSILSADTIARKLAGELPVVRVLFVSDVGGVFEPGATGRRVAVPVVTRELVERLRPDTGGRRRHRGDPGEGGGDARHRRERRRRRTY